MQEFTIVLSDVFIQSWTVKTGDKQDDKLHGFVTRIVFI